MNKIRKIKGFWLIVAGFVVAAALIVIGSVDYTLGKPPEEEDSGPNIIDTSEYVKQIESEVKILLSQINGVDKVNVMITLESDSENVYAYDSQNGSREYFTTGNGSSESAVLLRRMTPKLRGIAVVCGGGDSPVIQQKIISLLCALFDLPSTKVFVSG